MASPMKQLASKAQLVPTALGLCKSMTMKKPLASVLWVQLCLSLSTCPNHTQPHIWAQHLLDRPMPPAFQPSTRPSARLSSDAFSLFIHSVETRHR